MGKEVRRNYETAERAEQAWNDMLSNGVNCVYSSTGGDADGTGGEYELRFDKD